MSLLSIVDANKFTVVIFDIFDHNESTLSGIGLINDTIAVMFQRKTDSQQGKPNVSQTNMAHGPKAFYAGLSCQNLQNFMKPTIKSQFSDGFKLMSLTLNTRLLYDVKIKEQM